MDPVSHAIIGLSVFAMHQSPDISNPAFIGTLIGAVAPDLDIVTKIRSDYVYLKHHRVESHSIIGVVGIAVIVTLALSLFYPTDLLPQVFLWTMIGSISHILSDLLNSYGVSLLYPFSRKKYSLSLITIYDPVILLLSGYVLFFSKRSILENTSMAMILFLYLLIKQLNRQFLTKKIKTHYLSQCNKRIIENVSVMPSDYNIAQWDYIVSTEKEYIVGEINSLGGIPTAFRHLDKNFDPIIEKTQEETLGLYFKDFTPLFHIELEQELNGIIVKMIDLRYKVRNGFKHHAMFYYNENAELLRSVFHPFKMENQIEVSGNSMEL